MSDLLERLAVSRKITGIDYRIMGYLYFNSSINCSNLAEKLGITRQCIGVRIKYLKSIGYVNLSRVGRDVVVSLNKKILTRNRL